MSAPITAESGVVAFDMCTFNTSVLRLPRTILRAIRHRSKVDERIEDLLTSLFGSETADPLPWIRELQAVLSDLPEHAWAADPVTRDVVEVMNPSLDAV